MLRAAPFYLLLLLIGAASLFLGADTPAASLFFAGALCSVAALILIASPRPIGGWAWAGLLAVGLAFCVGHVNGWVVSGSGEYASLAAAFGVFAIAQISSREGRMAERLWQSTIAVGMVVAGTSFIDFIVDPEMFWGAIERPYGINRFSTPFLSANTAATFYGIIALLSLAEFIRIIRRHEPGARGAIERLSKAGAIPLAGLMLALTCVFLTASRGGATFLATALLLLTTWELLRGVFGGRKLNLKSAVSGLSVVALLALVFVFSGDFYAERMLDTGGRDTARPVMFSAYWEALPIAPLLGHGLGGFVFVSAFIAEADDARTIMFQGAAHNVVFQWMLQGGLVGLGFVIAMSGRWLLMMRRGLMRRNRQTGYMRAAVVAALFVAAHGMVDYALEIPAVLYLFAWVCGLGAGVATGGSRTLGPGGGPRVSRVMRFTAVFILATASTLSFWAFTDRASAISIARLEDRLFVELFNGESDLSGSPVRLETIGDRALALDEPDARMAALAFALAVEKEPRDGALEAKYAYARYIEMGFLPPDAAAALSRSYYRMPYGTREFAAWRLDFMEAVWAFLPESLKAAAVREARVYGPPRRLERLSGEVENL